MAPASSTAEHLAALEESLQTMTAQQATLQEENNNLREQVNYPTVESQHHEDATPSSTLTNVNQRVAKPKDADPKFFHGHRNKLSTFLNAFLRSA